MALVRIRRFGREEVRPTVFVETMRFPAFGIIAASIADSDDVVDEHIEVMIRLLDEEPRMSDVSVHMLGIPRLNIAVVHADALIIQPKSGHDVRRGIVESHVGLVIAGKGMKRSANRVNRRDVRLYWEARLVDVYG